MFRFTIRDLLWLTVVVALGVAWKTNDARLRAERNQLHEKAVNFEQTSIRWKGRAGALAQQLRVFGIPVMFMKSGGMGIGSIPPGLTPPVGSPTDQKNFDEE